MVGAVVVSLFLPGQMARCGRALFDRAQGLDVLAHGWNCRGSDNFSTREAWGSAQLGLPVLLGTGRYPHALLDGERRLSGRSARLEGMVIANGRGQPFRSEHRVWIAWRAQAHRTRTDWLPGYQESAPVRTGNAAYQQFQLDIFGELINTLFQCRQAGLEPRDGSEGVALALLEFLEGAWNKPDEGIWEMRGPRRHFVHSKVMAWVALDRAVRAVDKGWVRADATRWRALRTEIHDQVCQSGFDSGRNCFVQFYGSQHLDASLLMMPLVGFLPADDPRMLGTVKAIEENLTQNDFVGRYTIDPAVDGLPHGEGEFLACSFWLADNYILQGRRKDGERLFERLLSIRNDVGLLSEEYDPVNKRLLGNFPQAFSHVGLVNTAFNLRKDVKHPPVGSEKDPTS